MRTAANKYQIENQNSANIRVTPDSKERSPTLANPVCLNHYDKPATHALQSSQTYEKMHYCEKCSIMLASQGFNIIKLGKCSSTARRTPQPLPPLKTERQMEIESFIGELCWQIEEMQKKDSDVQYSLRASEAHFNGLMEEITRYYREIEDIIEVQKYTTYNAVLAQRSAIEAELRMLRESLENEVEELAGIGNDIQNNMEAVESVEAPIYQSIMNNYRNKLGLSYQFHQLDFDPKNIPKPTVVFPDIPKMLYSLADKIHLRNDNAPIQTITIPQDPPSSRPSLSQRSNCAKNMSCENSRMKTHLTSVDENRFERNKKSLSNLISLKNTESIDQKEMAFSFESNQAAYYSQEDCIQIPKVLFAENQKRTREPFHPQEMVFRESLSLTEIRQNDEYMETQVQRRYPSLLEETIPEQIATSHESLAGYFVADTLGYSLKDDTGERCEQTETLLIC